MEISRMSMNRIWNNISYLGLNNYDRSISSRNIIIANQINFIFIFILITLNILTFINREISGGSYTIHTQKLLILLIILILNILFSYKTWHNFTKINLIVFPSLTLFFLPIFYGHVQESDFIDAPVILIGSSIMPQLILTPKLSNTLYLISLLYFLILISCVDNLLVHFSAQVSGIVMSTNNFHFFHKLVLIPVFIFIQTSIYYFRNTNYSYENELVFINKKLNLTVEELKTTQEHLVESEKMASIGILAAGVAHEINNPLNFIHGGVLFLENYFKDNLPDHIENVLPVIDGINTGVKRTADIVKKLNQYNTDNTLLLSNCDLHGIIDNCLIMLNNQYENRIEVLKYYTEIPYTYQGNEEKLHEAFLNILENAVHAIEDKGKITILTNIVREAFQITITDNGHGITLQNIKKIFDPFFTTKAPGLGTGLGLSIAYNIIQEHHGTIKVESRPKLGTKVRVILPLIIK